MLYEVITFSIIISSAACTAEAAAALWTASMAIVPATAAIGPVPVSFAASAIRTAGSGAPGKSSIGTRLVRKTGCFFMKCSSSSLMDLICSVMSDRITSYNVCYTKLLRSLKAPKSNWFSDGHATDQVSTPPLRLKIKAGPVPVRTVRALSSPEINPFSLSSKTLIIGHGYSVDDFSASAARIDAKSAEYSSSSLP